MDILRAGSFNRQRFQYVLNVQGNASMNAAIFRFFFYFSA
ncbi:pheST operon leader peptide PheM [Edwardsiella piscicida]|nr:pheST operon leader peptide PheM [Edwardsiella piscicida]